jgi:hypothetical protein
MNFDSLKSALLSVLPEVYHYQPEEVTSNQYIVWAEDSQSSASWADDKMQDQTIQGTVDYFTKTEYDANFELIQAALNAAGISFKLNSIQYENDTKYIHYEWIFEV